MVDNALTRANGDLTDWPRFSNAVGCIDCEAIFNTLRRGVCPSCGSASIINLAEVLNREEVTP